VATKKDRKEWEKTVAAVEKLRGSAATDADRERH